MNTQESLAIARRQGDLSLVARILNNPGYVEQALAVLDRETRSEPVLALLHYPYKRTRSKSRYPDELTSREVEVLRLLAQGLTDAQIAGCLVISVRTVNNHTTSIYNKIGVSTRSAATHYAIESKLV